MNARPVNRLSGHVTLVELMLVTLFFALSSVVITRLFIASDGVRNASHAYTRAGVEAQDWADRLYAQTGEGADLRAFLLQNGWAQDADADALVLERGLYALVADGFEARDNGAGVLHACLITARRGGEALFALPVSRFVAHGEAPP